MRTKCRAPWRSANRILAEGFTLIELMIVVAIVGVLASIALPQYQIYTGRSQQTEPLHLAESLKTSVAEALQLGVATASINGGTAGIPMDVTANAGRYTHSLIVAAGTITANMKSADVAPCAISAVLSLTPSMPSPSAPVQWVCTSSSVCPPSTCN